MHPARSVIFFTTASGAGYGIMIWLAVLAALGEVYSDRLLGIVSLGLAFALIVGGLLSSTLHLGRPERAWRALSQWRSSWLSREGLAAVIAFVPLGIFAIAWVMLGPNSGVAALAGLVGAAMSLLTLYCTAMIYASLRPIPAWHNGWTVAGYMVLGPMSGAVLLTAILNLFGQSKPAALTALLSLALLATGLLIKLAYWNLVCNEEPVSTAGTATGLGHLGTVEMTGSPHDNDNYLLREMGFRIARKHAEKLRKIAVVVGFVLPFLCLLAAISLTGDLAPFLLSALATLSCAIGLATERWLFFAEAKHTVTLYYGQQAV